MAALVATPAFADDEYVDPVEVPYMAAQSVSANGLYIAGQDVNGNVVFLYDVANGNGLAKQIDYVITGNGSCVSNNGIIVGEQIAASDELACMVYQGKVYPLFTTKSALDAITPDGSRGCGYRYNSAAGGVMYIPYIVNINPDGTFGSVTNLPYPRKDFFGTTPYIVNALDISADGKTILGMVVDGAVGLYQWPIVWRQNANGSWSYTQPTETMYNPDKLPQPSTGGNVKIPDAPKAEDYLTPEQYEAWQEALKDNPTLSDEAYLFLSGESLKKYEEAVAEWNKKVDDLLGNMATDSYQKQLQKCGVNEQWLFNQMRLAPDGKSFMAVQCFTDSEFPGDIYKRYIPYIFEYQEDGTYTYRTLPESTSENDFLIPTQMLYDGTALLMSSPSSFLPYVTYVVAPGSNEPMEFMTFLENNIPSYSYWLEDSILTQYGIIGYDDNGEAIMGSYTITGRVSISNEYKTIVGGVAMKGSNSEAFSYVYYNPEGIDPSGVEEIAVDPVTLPEDDVYYNLQGVRVSNPTPGIYILNGKKIIIK